MHQREAEKELTAHELILLEPETDCDMHLRYFLRPRELNDPHQYSQPMPIEHHILSFAQKAPNDKQELGSTSITRH